MQDYFENRESLFSVLILVDMRRDIEPEDEQLSCYFQSLGLKVIGIQTKCDKVNKSKWLEMKKKQAVGLKLSPEQIVTTSADKKLGLTDIFKMMAGHLDTYE